MDTACHRGKNRKYAANSKLAEYTGMLQLLYLRFLYVKRTVCSWVPEFAADFRRAVPEVRGKIKIGRPDPGFAFPRPAVLLPKIGLCSEVSDFSPHFRNTRYKSATLKRKRDNYPQKNSPLTWKPPFGGFHGPSRTYRRKASSQLKIQEITQRQSIIIQME